MTHPGICSACRHDGETFESGLCLRCEWDRLRAIARDLDTEEAWGELAWLNEQIQETIG
jgi:hypothetical protein